MDRLTNDPAYAMMEMCAKKGIPYTDYMGRTVYNPYNDPYEMNDTDYNDKSNSQDNGASSFFEEL